MNQTPHIAVVGATGAVGIEMIDRKSTRLNSSHSQISYAVFCLKKKHLCALDRIIGMSRLAPNQRHHGSSRFMTCDGSQRWSPPPRIEQCVFLTHLRGAGGEFIQ